MYQVSGISLQVQSQDLLTRQDHNCIADDDLPPIYYSWTSASLTSRYRASGNGHHAACTMEPERGGGGGV